MARTNGVYDAVRKEAHTEACKVALGVLQECFDSPDMTENELFDAIHQAVDDALTYTSDQWCFAWGLPDASDDSLSSASEGFDATLTAKAYENLREYVETSPFFDAARELIEAREEYIEGDEETWAARNEATDAAKSLLKEG